MSLSARRAWIEIESSCIPPYPNGSLSARRAWIEIGSPATDVNRDSTSLSARRAWIEIDGGAGFIDIESRRSPQGERGLKSLRALGAGLSPPSLSARRAWIEISAAGSETGETEVALRKESVD